MDLQFRINQIKNERLRKIKEAATNSDTDSIISNSKILEEVERLEKKLNEISNTLDNLESYTFEITNEKNIEEVSAKERGNIRRNEFIEKIKTIGINLIQKRGVIYKINDGRLIGIASASERIPNKWFLGLPGNNYDHVVLLCENSKKEVLSFILSKDFYKKYENNLSSDSNGQIKFNIYLRNGKYQINIPQTGNINIDEFIDKYDVLRNF